MEIVYNILVISILNQIIILIIPLFPDLHRKNERNMQYCNIEFPCVPPRRAAFIKYCIFSVAFCRSLTEFS